MVDSEGISVLFAIEEAQDTPLGKRAVWSANHFQKQFGPILENSLQFLLFP